MRFVIPMLSLLAAYVLSGCASAPVSPATTTPPAPLASLPSEVIPPVAKTPEQTPAAPPVTPPATKPGGKPINENRLYQLNELEQVKLRINGHTIKAWVMNTSGKLQEGMMHLNQGDVADDEGMIFVYPEPRQMDFWMRNTRIGLDIAFVDAQKRILNVATMKPFDDNTTPSRGAAVYAIEVKQGIFKRIGARAGQKVELPPLKFQED